MWVRVLINRTLRVMVQKTSLAHSCLCSRDYHALSLVRKCARISVYSVHTDPQRQKAVIETAAPKIVLDKSRITKELWDKIDPYVKLARLDKPIGICLLYWPCSWSLALGAASAGLEPRGAAALAGLFLAGAVLMRGAGCTLNDIIDRDIDRQVARTKDRPLASGAVTPRAAAAFLAAQLSAALAVLLQLNAASVALGASSLVLVATYPYAKRYTNYPQVHLGATFAWGALLGHCAVTGGLTPAAGLMYGAAVAWTVMYDTVYAHQDKLDDARIGIKSTALTFGHNTKPVLTGVALLSGALFAAAGAAAGLAWPYYAAVAAASAHAGHQIYTLQPDCPDDCARKFKSNNWIGLLILLGVLGGGYPQYVDKRRERLGAEAAAAAAS